MLSQNSFPVDFQEVVLSNGDVNHISDVCLSDVAIEYQHSPISKEDIIEPSKYYLNTKKHLIWVFDCFGKTTLFDI